jgi:hypothetical protein
VISLRLFNIIIVIMPRKRVVHVGGRGWGRVTLMAARRIMTGRRHNEREEKEEGRRAPGVVVVVVVVQGTPALNVT